MKFPPGYVPGVGVPAPAPSSFGERLMRQLGWEKGQGLGKQGQGMKEAIQVKKKEDTSGVGADNRWNWGEKWWEQAYNSAVAAVGQEASSSSSDSDSDDDSNVRFTRRTEERRRKNLNRDGTVTTATAEELQIAAELAKQPWGRFGGKEGKMARIRKMEQEQEQHRLSSNGNSGTSSQTEQLTETSADVRSDKKTERKKKRKSSADSTAEQVSVSIKKKKKKKSTSAADSAQERSEQLQEMTNQEQPTCAQASTAAEPPHSMPSDWWGARYFVCAGNLESLKPSDKNQQRRTFDEHDQASLYNATDAKKAKGKQGLGVGQGSGKVGGVRWSGTKCVFDDEAQEEGISVGAVDTTCAPASTCTPTSDGGAPRMKTVDSLESIKWKKLMQQAMNTFPGGEVRVKMFVKEVSSAVRARYNVKQQYDKAQLKSIVLQQVEQSNRVKVNGKIISWDC